MISDNYKVFFGFAKGVSGLHQGIVRGDACWGLWLMRLLIRGTQGDIGVSIQTKSMRSMIYFMKNDPRCTS